MRTETGSSKIVRNDFEHQRLVLMARWAIYTPTWDLGGRAMQEQLATMYFVILPAQPYKKIPDYMVRGLVNKLSQL